MTSLQKGNETEWEMEVLDVFSVLAQVILMQTVMKTPVSQNVDLAWKPLKIEGPQLEIEETKQECKNEQKSQMNTRAYNLAKLLLRK